MTDKIFAADKHETTKVKLSTFLCCPVRLSTSFGIKGTVLAWFQSYLTSRQQYVHVAECKSSLCLLTRGVPQGSVLRLLLYLIYTSPIGKIIRHHGLQCHLYADDLQLYVLRQSLQRIFRELNLELSYAPEILTIGCYTMD